MLGIWGLLEMVVVHRRGWAWDGEDGGIEQEEGSMASWGCTDLRISMEGYHEDGVLTGVDGTLEPGSKGFRDGDTLPTE